MLINDVYLSTLEIHVDVGIHEISGRNDRVPASCLSYARAAEYFQALRILPQKNGRGMDFLHHQYSGIWPKL